MYDVPSLTSAKKKLLSKGQLKKVKPGQDGNSNWLFQYKHNAALQTYYDKDKRYFKLNGLKNTWVEESSP